MKIFASAVLKWLRTALPLTEGGGARKWLFSEPRKAEDKMRLANVSRWKSRYYWTSHSLLMACFTVWNEAGQFFLDTGSAELLVCLRGRGTREIHRQMQACACRLSGNTHQRGVGVYLEADFFFFRKTYRFFNGALTESQPQWLSIFARQQ